jgi:hypothetical protein
LRTKKRQEPLAATKEFGTPPGANVVIAGSRAEEEPFYDCGIPTGSPVVTRTYGVVATGGCHRAIESKAKA